MPAKMMGANTVSAPAQNMLCDSSWRPQKALQVSEIDREPDRRHSEGHAKRNVPRPPPPSHQPAIVHAEKPAQNRIAVTWLAMALYEGRMTADPQDRKGWLQRE